MSETIEPISSIVINVHRQAMGVSIQEAAALLQEILTRRVTAFITGVKDAKTITRWINGEVSDIRIENEQKLRTAYEIVQLLTQFDSPATVRAWFLGMNPQLNDDSPIEVLNEGRSKDVLAAAKAFIAGG